MMNRLFFSGIAVVIILMFSALTVQGASDRRENVQDAYYKQLEDNYYRILRETMEEEGFHNAGITITHISNGDGTRDYKVSFYHGRLNRMSEDAKAELKDEILALGFSDNSCEIDVNFIAN